MGNVSLTPASTSGFFQDRKHVGVNSFCKIVSERAANIGSRESKTLLFQIFCHAFGVDYLARESNCSVEVLPLALNLDVRLVTPPAKTYGFLPFAKFLFKFRRIL
jgi:hypothetical protein